MRCRRSGTHPFTSNEIAAGAGAALLDDFRERGVPLSVNLRRPDWDISIEVRQNRAYLFSEVMKGVGGFPLGTQGKATLLIEEICDTASIVAAGWLMMKRGCLTFPFILGDAPGLEEKAREVVEILREWDPDIRLDDQGEGGSETEALNLEVFMRRYRLMALVRALKVEHFRGGHAEISPQYPEIFPIVGLPEEKVEELFEMISS